MFRIICRAVLDPGQIAKLDERKGVVYVRRDESTDWPSAEWQRHLLEIEAPDQAQALKTAREAMKELGVDGADISPA